MSKKFKRPEFWKYKCLGTEWRMPRGAKNPARRGHAGRQPLPSPGYRKPESERGLHPSGLREARVFNDKDLEGLDPKTTIVRIGGSVGMKKRLVIFAKAKKLKLRVIQNEPKSTKKDIK